MHGTIPYSLPNKNKIDRSLVEKYDNFMKSKYISYIDKLTSFLSEEYIKHCGDKLGCSKELYQITFLIIPVIIMNSCIYN